MSRIRSSSQNHLRSVFLGTVLLLFLILPVMRSDAAPGAAPRRSAPAVLDDPAELEAFLDKQIGAELGENHIPGAAVAVVKDGKVLASKGYGACVLETDTPASAQAALYQIGSVGKLLTASAVMQLAEQGRVDLHADVNAYLKKFKIPATYPQPITLAHLLTHSAGFEDHITGSDAPSINELEPLEEWLTRHMPARVRPPGQLTAYSNYGFALAGFIVSQVSSMPFEQYLEQYVFQPLQMRSSTSRQPLPSDLAPDLCTSYAYTGSGYRANPFEVLNDVPAGAVSTTAADMANFMIAHLEDGRFGSEKILQPATVQTMHAQQFTNDPRVPGETYGFEEMYVNGQRLITHGGLTSDFYSFLALLPEQHVGLFVSYNSQGGMTSGGALLQVFMDRYFPATKGAVSAQSPGSAERVSKIAGDYWPTRRGYTTYEKLFGLFKGASVADGGNGRALISPFAGSKFSFVEVEPWVFRLVDGTQTIVFRPDSTGMLMFIDNDPAQAMVKVPWYEGPPAHLAALGVSMLVFISALLLWPMSFLQGRRQAERSADGEELGAVFRLKQGQARREWTSLLPAATSWLGAVLCGLNVVLLIALGVFASGMGPYPAIFRGVTPLLTSVFVLALGSAVLTVGSVAGAVAAWLGGYWNTGRRVHYALIAAAAIAFVFELAYWNLLGFKA